MCYGAYIYPDKGKLSKNLWRTTGTKQYTYTNTHNIRCHIAVKSVYCVIFYQHPPYFDDALAVLVALSFSSVVFVAAVSYVFPLLLSRDELKGGFINFKRCLVAAPCF